MATPQHTAAVEAELSVLGGIILDNSATDRVSGLKAEDFFTRRHQAIFRHILALSETGGPVDPVTIAMAMERSGELDDAGGLDYVLGLGTAAATAINIEHHAKLIQEQAEVRRLVGVCTGIVEKAQGGDYDDVGRLFDEAQQAVYDVGNRRQTRAFTDLPTALKDVISKVQKAYEVKASVTGTPTGFIDLDGMTAGLQPGDLIIVAGRPSMGKTAFALNLATNAANLGQGAVAIFSLEMPTTQLVARMLANEARVDSERMRSGHLQDGDVDRLLNGVRSMSNWKIYIDDTASATVMEIRAKCRRLAAERGGTKLSLVVIDYLQLMRGSGGRASREQEISEISRSLKGMAKELGVPVVALSQLNRGLESRPNKRPMMSDLRESGAIEQDADVIMFVYRDEVYNENTDDKGVAEIIIGKQRNGPIGTCRLKFSRQWTRFDNLAKDH